MIASVEHFNAVGRQRAGNPPRSVRRNRAVIDDQRSRACAADDSAIAEDHLFDGFRIRDHGHDDVSA
jgi:hypothetical protein